MAEKWITLLVENVTVTFDMGKTFCEHERSSSPGL
jgi:hypothetical protein